MAKKEKKSHSGTILAFFIAIIMVSSILGYVSSDSQGNKVKYNDIKFIKTQTQWLTTINKQQIAFDYFPTEVETINISSDVVSALLNKPEIDITSGINDTFAEEIALSQYNMFWALNNFNIYVRQGFTTNNTFNLKIITCKESTSSVPVIYFKQSNITRIFLEDNCIIAEAKNNIDILRIKDRLLYSMFGIIK